VECAEQNNSDMVMWDFTTFWKSSQIERKLPQSSVLKSQSTNDKISLLKRPAFAWTKLIRTEKARELKVEFPVGLTRQDIPVHWHLITSIDNISVLPERLSYYRQQPEATTHKSDSRLFDLATVMDKVGNYLMEAKLYNEYKNEYLRQQLGLLYGMVDFINQDLKAEAHGMLMSRLGEDQWTYIRGDNELSWQKCDFYLAMDGSTFAKLRRSLWLSARSIYRFLRKKQ